MDASKNVNDKLLKKYDEFLIGCLILETQGIFKELSAKHHQVVNNNEQILK